MGNHEVMLYLNIKMNLLITLLGLVEPQHCFNLVYTFIFKKCSNEWFLKSIVTIKLINITVTQLCGSCDTVQLGKGVVMDSLKSYILE